MCTTAMETVNLNPCFICNQAEVNFVYYEMNSSRTSATNRHITEILGDLCESNGWQFVTADDSMICEVCFTLIGEFDRLQLETKAMSGVLKTLVEHTYLKPKANDIEEKKVKQYYLCVGCDYKTRELHMKTAHEKFHEIREKRGPKSCEILAMELTSDDEENASEEAKKKEKPGPAFTKKGAKQDSMIKKCTVSLKRLREEDIENLKTELSPRSARRSRRHKAKSVEPLPEIPPFMPPVPIEPAEPIEPEPEPEPVVQQKEEEQPQQQEEPPKKRRGRPPKSSYPDGEAPVVNRRSRAKSMPPGPYRKAMENGDIPVEGKKRRGRPRRKSVFDPDLEDDPLTDLQSLDARLNGIRSPRRRHKSLSRAKSTMDLLRDLGDESSAPEQDPFLDLVENQIQHLPPPPPPPVPIMAVEQDSNSGDMDSTNGPAYCYENGHRESRDSMKTTDDDDPSIVEELSDLLNFRDKNKINQLRRKSTMTDSSSMPDPLEITSEELQSAVNASICMNGFQTHGDMFSEETLLTLPLLQEQPTIIDSIPLLIPQPIAAATPSMSMEQPPAQEQDSPEQERVTTPLSDDERRLYGIREYYECVQCGERKKYYTMIASHSKTIHGMSDEEICSLYDTLEDRTCKYCDRVCESWQEKRSHIQKHRERARKKEFWVFVSKVGGLKARKRAKIYSELDAESSRFGLPGSYQCMACQSPFKEFRTYKAHFSKCHKDEEIDFLSRYDTAQNRWCPHCERTFPTLEEKIRHVRLVVKKETLDAGGGNEVVKSVRSIVEQMPQKERDAFLKKMRVRFEQQKLEEKRRKRLQLHSFRKIKPKPVYSSALMCNNCNTAFPRLENLARHVRNKQCFQKREAVCPICSSRYEDAIALNRHLSTSHNIHNPLFLCDRCGANFKTKISLYYHLLNHSDNPQPYKCTYEGCDKAFRTPQHKHLHIQLIHRNDRRHGCDKCPMKFPTKYRLKVHRMRHTRHKLIHCSVCPRGFYRRYELRLHLEEYHGQTIEKDPLGIAAAKARAKEFRLRLTNGNNNSIYVEN